MNTIRKALEWYEDQARSAAGDGAEGALKAIQLDGGKRAREALAEIDDDIMVSVVGCGPIEGNFKMTKEDYETLKAIATPLKDGDNEAIDAAYEWLQETSENWEEIDLVPEFELACVESEQFELFEKGEKVAGFHRE